MKTSSVNLNSRSQDDVVALQGFEAKFGPLCVVHAGPVKIGLTGR